VRTWSNQEGQKLEGKLVEVREDEILLADQKDERTLHYPLWALSEDDQAYVARWLQYRQTRLGQILQGNLLRLDDDEEELEPANALPEIIPQIYGIFQSAQWVPLARETTPAVVEFYEDKRDDREDFQFILVSHDKSEEEFLEYMRSYEIPFPAVDWKVGRRVDEFEQWLGAGIPSLTIVDAMGNVLASSFPQPGQYLRPEKVLEILEAEIFTKPLPALPEVEVDMSDPAEEAEAENEPTPEDEGSVEGG
jgi:hypothetical protein